MTLGERIYKLRTEKEMSQGDLADALEVSRQSISKWETKYSGNGKSEKYVIVFSVGGKKKSFYVSQFSYNGYRINEKGTLKYKGDKLIDFK